MLNAMREGAKHGITKFILFGFMVMAVGGLVLMDVGGFFRGGVTKTAVVKIEGEELPIQIFDRTVRRTLASQGLDIDTAYRLGFINQILQNEISNNITQRAAADMGLMVADPVVLEQLNKILEPMVNEEMTKKQALELILRRQGMTERDMVRMIKAEMTNGLLRTMLSNGTNIISEKEAIDMYLYEHEEREIEYVILSHDTIKGMDEPAEEILLPFYQAGQERYAIAENRSFTLVILSSEKLEGSIDISDEELRDIYEQDIATFAVPEQRLMEQAILDDQEVAVKIYQAVSEGQDFKKAVLDSSGSEDGYLGEDTFEEEGLSEALAEAAFSAEIGKVIEPVQTPLGWHVVVVKKSIPPTTTPFEDVKKELKSDILSLRLADELFAAANRVDDSFASGMSLEEVAKELDLEVQAFGPVLENGSTLDLKDGLKGFEADKAYILETAYSLLEQEVSPVFELQDGRYAALRVDTIIEKTYKPFEEVKADLAKVWIQDQKEVENKLRTQEALKAIKNNEKTISQIASDVSSQSKKSNIKRNDETPSDLTDASVKLFFNLAVGETGFAPAQNGYVLGTVKKAKLLDRKDIDEKKLDSYVVNTTQTGQREISQIYLNTLFDQYTVKVNQRLIDMTYGPGSEQL